MARHVPSDLSSKARTGSTAAKYAVEFWREYAGPLEREGRLTDLDYASFEMLCLAYGGLRATEIQIAEEGETILTYQERGELQRLVKHPASAARNEHRRSFLDLADRFGLNPKARGNLRPPQHQPAASSTAGQLLD